MSEPSLWMFALTLIALFAFIYRAAGRLTPRVVLAPLLFLVTRAPVLVAWAVGAIATFAMIAMIAMIVHSAQSNGKDPFANLPLLVGLSVFCGLGVTVGPAFLIVRALGPAPRSSSIRASASTRRSQRATFLGASPAEGRCC